MRGLNGLVLAGTILLAAAAARGQAGGDLLAPGTAVTREALRAAVLLELQKNPPPAGTPGVGIGFSSIVTQEQMDQGQPGFPAAMAKVAGELAASLAAKTPEARAVSVKTLVTYPAPTVSPADMGKVRPWVPEMFETMTAAQMTYVLEGKWPGVKSAELLPVLLKVYANPPKDEQNARYGAAEVTNAVLLRAYQIDAAKVRPLMLEAIRDPSKFDSHWMEALLELPDKTLPEMDDAFAKQIAGRQGLTQKEVSMRLISRYGSAKILPEVKAVFEVAPGRSACAVQASMLSYFLRVDDAYGTEAFSKCLASRQTGCWRSLFMDVGRQVWTPALEKLAVGALTSTEPEVVTAATRMLKTRGSADAQQALSAALAELGVGTQRRVFVDALMHGHAWLLPAEEMRKLAQGESEKPYRDAILAEAEWKEIDVEFRADERGNSASASGLIWLSGEYYGSMEELQRKVALYPARTVVHIKGATDDALRKAFENWARERKIPIE